MPENEEPERGERLIRVTISDGTSQSSIIITVNVVILNNHPPDINFAGSSNVSFTEDTPVPLALGSLLLPVISDTDSNGIFLMESARVELLGAVNGMDEMLTYDISTVNALGITVNGM